MTLSAFHNQPAVRQSALQHFADNLQAQKIYAGNLFYDGKKCSVAGSLINSGDAEQWIAELGLPLWFAYALDAITNPIRPQFLATEVEKIIHQIPLGADISALAPQVIAAFLQQIDPTLLADCPLAEVLPQVNAIYQQQLQQQTPTAATWRKLRQSILLAKDSLAILTDHPKTKDLPLARQHAIGNILEACAWNSLNSATTVSEVIQYWIYLLGLDSDQVFGWSDQDLHNIETALEQMHSDYILGHEHETRDVYQLLEEHRPELAERLRAYYRHGTEQQILYGKQAAAILLTVLRTAA